MATCRKWAAESGKHVWFNVLLTSAGFEDLEGRQRTGLVDRFLKMLGKSANKARVLFIPTAAVSAEARKIAEHCRRELVGIGISEGNMTVCDMDGSLSESEAMEYDAVYLTGGDTEYLLRRVRETGFDVIIKKMVHANKVYVGVSVGSYIATPNIGGCFDERTAGLALINAYISVHQPEGAAARTDLPLPHIPLTDNQALAVSWCGYEIVEG